MKVINPRLHMQLRANCILLIQHSILLTTSTGEYFIFALNGCRMFIFFCLVDFIVSFISYTWVLSIDNEATY